jgi:hypothetical protein
LLAFSWSKMLWQQMFAAYESWLYPVLENARKLNISECA